MSASCWLLLVPEQLRKVLLQVLSGEAAESSSSETEVSEASSAQEEDREDGVSSTDDSDASEKSAEQTTPAEGKIAEVSSVPGLPPPRSYPQKVFQIWLKSGPYMSQCSPLKSL